MWLRLHAGEVQSELLYQWKSYVRFGVVKTEVKAKAEAEAKAKTY